MRHAPGGRAGSPAPAPEAAGSSSSSSSEVAAAALQDRFASMLGMGSVGRKSGTMLASDVHLRPVRSGESRSASRRRQWEERLTLAQCVGIEERPRPLMSPAQWRRVVGKSRERNASAEPCAICLQPFQGETQIILSCCANVFHRECIARYEQVIASRQRGRRSCPMCRSGVYERRRIQDGRRQWEHRCATLIQAHVRGHLARRRARALREVVPPTEATRRRRFYERRLGRMSEDILRGVESSEGDIERLFRELDTSLAQSRALPDISARDRGAAGAAASSSTGAVDWARVLARSRARDRGDCAICISSLARAGPGFDTACFLTDCGHAFHIVRISRRPRRAPAARARLALTPGRRPPARRTASSRGRARTTTRRGGRRGGCTCARAAGGRTCARSRGSPPAASCGCSWQTTWTEGEAGCSRLNSFCKHPQFNIH